MSPTTTTTNPTTLSPTTNTPVSPSLISPKSARKLPLLSLAPPALAWDELEWGEPGGETHVGEIWNVITRAADLVKDGERLENLAWRHWGSPLRISRRRSSSSISSTSTSLHTPPSPLIPFLQPRPTERRTFGASLKLLLEPTPPSPLLTSKSDTTPQDLLTPSTEATFRDWITDAKRRQLLPLPPPPPPPLPPPPTISLPDTPIANHVEIRLVEPTPVPSRVGSLGGSLAASGLLGSSMSVVPPRLNEEDEEGGYEEEEVMVDSEDEEGVVIKPITAPKSIHHNTSKHPHHSKSPKKKGKFFVQSSPSKGSGSDSPHPSPVGDQVGSLAPSSMPRPAEGESGSSSGEVVKMKVGKNKEREKEKEKEKGKGKEGVVNVGELLFGGANGVAGVKEKEGKRHVSLSTMRGRFTAEKRKAAEALKAKEEDSGWEDDEEDAGDDDGEEGVVETKADKGKGVEKSSTALESFKSEEEGDWSDEPEIQEKARKPSLTITTDRRRSASKDRRSSSNLDMNALLMRTKSRTSHTGNTPPKETPPPPAPTPLRNMTKKQRLAAQEERAKIEAELDAQRKREMFAKQQIFGKGKGSVGGAGLLTGMFKTGGSMVDLTRAPEGSRPGLRSSPTHGHLSSLSRSPAGPSLLRSKSAVAMPIQTGVSVNAEPHTMVNADSRHSSAERSSKGSKGSQEARAPAGVVLESSDEGDSDDDDYLATSKTQRKIAELAAKRDAKSQNQAVPVVPNGVRVDDQGVALGLSPTSRRRQIIMNEMSESLRRNLIIERQKSSGGTSRHNSFGQAHSRPPPSTHTQPRNNSTTNLQQYNHGAPLERHRSEPRMQQPLPQNQPQQPYTPQLRNVSAPIVPLTSSPSPIVPQLPNPPTSTQPPPRRPGSTVLGGGFLRPLTRVGNSPANITRTQSSATLASPTAHGAGHSKSPSPVLGGVGRVQGYEAPAMVRRSTEGDPREFVGSGSGSASGSGLGLGSDQRRRRELRGRELEGDTSFRAHGW